MRPDPEHLRRKSLEPEPIPNIYDVNLIPGFLICILCSKKISRKAQLSQLPYGLKLVVNNTVCNKSSPLTRG
jgi:hypothetical protein